MNIDQHHLKAYIFFLVLSIVVVGILAYLYVPSGGLRSDVLASGEVSMSAEEWVVSEEIWLIPQEISPDAIAARRMHFTNMLLRYQGQLNTLESNRIKDPDNQEILENIKQIQVKIESLQSRIAQLAK